MATNDVRTATRNCNVIAMKFRSRSLAGAALVASALVALLPLHISSASGAPRQVGIDALDAAAPVNALKPAERLDPPKPTPTPSGGFTTLPVGAALPSSAQCAASVRPAAEIRPENRAANQNRGSRANANNRSDWSGFDRVDGDFVGTTDEIIQWAACKWGIDEDIARAQVVKESWWRQSANGDGGQSWGLGQVRDSPGHWSAFQYSINARNSTAYNLDYTYAVWRACYEGVYTWLNTVERGRQYAAGDVWGCTGVWFSGRWYTQAAVNYIEGGETFGYGVRGVKQHLALRTWEDPVFING